MSDFEKEYYEEAGFWEQEMLQDEPNRLRIKFTSELIPKEAKTIADIGCGNGVFVNYLHEQDPQLDIIAIDRSETALQFVKTAKAAGDIAAIPLDDRSYDCVTCLEVIEHLPNGVFETALSELARVSKRYIIISVPYNEKLEERYNKCPSCKTIFNHDLHLRSFSDEKIAHLLDEHGFTCIASHHLGQNVTYKGHHTFRKYIYPEQFYNWRSPICPLCGYKKPRRPEDKHVQILHSEKSQSLKARLLPFLTSIPKLLWPKHKRDYWIIGLYERTSLNNNNGDKGSAKG